MALGARDFIAAGRPGSKGNRYGGNLAPTDQLLGSYSGPSADSRPRREAGYNYQADPLRMVRRRRQRATKPTSDQLHYAHLFGQNVILWGGLAVFLVLLASRQHRTGLLHGLMRKVAVA
jgi:hypothetical protein